MKYFFILWALFISIIGAISAATVIDLLGYDSCLQAAIADSIYAVGLLACYAIYNHERIFK